MPAAAQRNLCSSVNEEQLHGPLTNEHSFYITKKLHHLLEYLGKQNKQNDLFHLIEYSLWKKIKDSLNPIPIVT